MAYDKAELQKEINDKINGPVGERRGLFSLDKQSLEENTDKYKLSLAAKVEAENAQKLAKVFGSPRAVPGKIENLETNLIEAIVEKTLKNKEAGDNKLSKREQISLNGAVTTAKKALAKEYSEYLDGKNTGDVFVTKFVTEVNKIQKELLGKGI